VFDSFYHEAVVTLLVRIFWVVQDDRPRIAGSSLSLLSAQSLGCQ